MSVLIRIRKVGLLFGVVLLTACGGGGGESSSDNERVDAYSASPNFNYQLTQEVQSNTSERWQAYYALQIESALNPLNKLDGLVPNTITVTYAVCGLSSLFYSSNDQSITVCDEFIDDAIEFAAEYGGIYYHDLVTYIVVFGLYQEIAKALVDIHGIPVTVSGGVESTANSIASVMVGETGRSLSALFGGWFLLEQSSSSYGVSIDDEELIVDIICLAFGSDSNFSYRPDLQETFEPLIEEGRDCVNEYEVERNGLYSSIPVLSELNNTDEVVPSLIAVSDESPPKFNNEPLLPLLVNGQDFWVCV